jgi:hypothetical protein
MMKLLAFITFMFASSAFATPQKLEMIFLSPKKVSMIIEMLDRYQVFKHSRAIAQNGMENCTPMGDGCFHPQLGFIEKSVDEKNPSLLDEKKLELKTFNATDVNLVNCDKDNYFDIFCGKTGPDAKLAETEIWFDISSSLRTVDYNKDPEQCARRSFMEWVQSACKGKLRVSVYNTAIKEMGDHSSVCMAYGTNDQTRLLNWLKDSKARNLLIVTDIDEVSSEMKDFLEINGAKMTGDGVKSFTTDDLVNYADDFSKLCK